MTHAGTVSRRCRILPRFAGAALVVAAGAAPVLGQGGPTQTLGQITGQIADARGTMTAEWRMIARGDHSERDMIGASIVLDSDDWGTGATIRLNALPSAAPAPAGRLRGNGFLQIDMLFDLPPDATIADLASTEVADAQLVFVEVWPSTATVPALQYSTMFNPVDVDITALNVTDGGLDIEGSATGRACLFVYHADDQGHWEPFEARVMGEPVCPRITVQFASFVPEI